MAKKYNKDHRAEYSHRGALFAALAASQLRYIACMLAVLRVIEGQRKAPSPQGA